MFMSPGMTSISYLGKGNEGMEEKAKGGEKVKLHLDFFYFIFAFLCDGLAAAANADFQFSKHLGLPCLLNVCKKREEERDKLHNNVV